MLFMLLRSKPWEKASPAYDKPDIVFGNAGFNFCIISIPDTSEDN
jgi:hypothetical protein